MTETLTAIVGALAVVVLAVGVVQPVALAPARRPRAVRAPSPVRVPELRCPPALLRALERAGLGESSSQWAGLFAGALVLSVVLGAASGGPVFALFVGGGVVAGAGVALHLAGARHEARLVAALPDTLDAIARATRAGSSLVQAVEGLGGSDGSPADRLLVTIGHRVARGEAFGASVAHLAARHPLPSVRLALAALAVGHETGAPPARAVEGVATTLRDRAAIEREARALASQARASAWVLVVAPVAFSAFTVATDPRVGEFLFRSPLGWACLGLGLTLDLLGAWWMRSIMGTAR